MACCALAALLLPLAAVQGQTWAPGDQGRRTDEPKATGNWTYPPMPTGNWTYPPMPTGNWTYPPTPTGNWTYPPMPTGNWTYPPVPTGNWTYPPTPTGNWTYPPMPTPVVTSAPTSTPEAPSCSWAAATSPWTRAHRDWCCAPGRSEQPAFCADPHAALRAQCTSPSAPSALHATCCETLGLRCADEHDCTAPHAELPAAAAEWCCAHRNVGCPCAGGVAPASPLLAARCCKLQFLGCGADDDASSPTVPPAAGARATLRLALRGDAAFDVPTNPRMVLCRLRRALLLASEVLRSEPSRLAVRSLAVVAPQGAAPADEAGRWEVAVLPAWNDVCIAEELVAFDAARPARALQSGDSAAAAAAAAGPEYTVEFDVKAADAAAVDAAVKELREETVLASSGSTRSRSVWAQTHGGTAEPLHPISSEALESVQAGGAAGRQDGGGSDGSSSSSGRPWVWAAVGSALGLSALCGLVSFFAVRKRQQQQRKRLGQLDSCDLQALAPMMKDLGGDDVEASPVKL